MVMSIERILGVLLKGLEFSHVTIFKEVNVPI